MFPRNTSFVLLSKTMSIVPKRITVVFFTDGEDQNGLNWLENTTVCVVDCAVNGFISDQWSG